MERNNISILNATLCSGCGVCNNICPTSAISMEKNKDGFLYPHINKDKCVLCGLCSDRCPVLNPVYNNDKNPECHAIWAKDDIRMQAASGGVFSAFANVILKRGGVIAGAAYNDDLSVSLITADDVSGLERIRSSKYMQANPEHVYKDIKKALDSHREVLFGGCPCQVAGLYSYLGKKYDKLYTMDLICHGIPSDKVFKKYIDDEYGRDNVESIDFRAKEFYGWTSSITIKLKNGEIARKSSDTDSFYRAFLPCMSLRKSCSSCKFSCLPRQGDITIGDFWGISHYKKELNDKKGCSVILINMQRAGI